MFHKESDFEAFEQVMVKAHPRRPIRIVSYCDLVITLSGGRAGELDDSRQRSFDQEGIRPSAGEHRERTTIRRREVGAGNGKRSRVGSDRSSGRQPTESEPIGATARRLGLESTLRSRVRPLLPRASAVRTWTRLSDYPEALAGSRVPNRAWENALDPATVLIVNDDRTSRHDGARRERAAVDVRVSPNHASIADR
jgi:hypothetical protein